ncbi:glycoside hydrolase family 97 protein [Kibdelosporangium aridum]|uniref:Glycosyl-hydrolase 97 C-terminal, oligomerisation n=1 Tax=Kibdelosporangium aridum TaxID=2030 RepID=A0A1Y5XCU1_KIBAR|nr:glycoside hydrolase family 97 protein [Kibdelosporangium aridum]SMC86523.1 Glycosyl-hydrolase 97 C-terminal, oligomerisation [Kibdelosporangium aridum]
MNGRVRVMLGVTLLVIALAVPATSQASPGLRWTLTAPARSEGPTAIVRMAGGRLTLEIKHNGNTVLEPSALGVETAHRDFTQGLRYTGMSQRFVRETYRTSVGRRLQHVSEAAETTLRFAGINVVVRVSADGVAYRYVFDTPNWVTVVREASEFAVPRTADSFLLPYDNGRGDYESIHVHRAVADQDPVEYGYPALFKVDDTWLALMESDLDGNYGGSRVRLANGRFQLVLPDPTETAKAPLATPWRTMVVGDLATVVESDLVTDLARPSEITDTSWIKPGRAAWSWWGPGTGNLALQKRYVDYAASQGWEYNLVDAGWSADWIPELVSYARERGVGIWLWVRWQTIDTDSERERLLRQYSDWGAAGLKIDFVESDGQDRMRWYDAVYAAAAKYRLMLNFHGAPIPRGVERTWPHVMTVEAVRGGEGTRPRPGREPFPIEHYLTLPFTRNLTGSMDFTPVTFSGVRPNSDAAELALSVVYESGVQHLADRVEVYATQPLAEQLLRTVPAAWDETRLVAGEPGRLAVLARKSGSDWYVGAITAGDQGRIAVPLDFLPDGTWKAELYADGADGKITFSTHAVAKGETLTVPTARNGGFAIRLTR